MDVKELKQWREDFIRLENDYRREVPEVKRVQQEHSVAISDLQTAEINEKQRMGDIADMAIEKYMKQKGRQLERWTPLIVSVLGTAGIIGAAYLGYQGIIAQVAGALKGITP